MGQLVLFLHAHLPFVRHPHEPGILQEDWLYEAITEVYLPLCDLFERWHRDGIPSRITISLSPPLLCMLRDEVLITRYTARLGRLIDLATRESKRTLGTPQAPLARMYRDRLVDSLAAFEDRYGRDLVGAFAKFQARGQLEIATSAASHAYLPLFESEPDFVRAQIRIGVRAHEAAFGQRPAGFWLPECGFESGLDRALAEEGLRYFVVDTHGVTNSDPPPSRGWHAPIVCRSGLFAFPRDPSSSESVWSSAVGYPSDPRYRERYRDVGYDLAASELEGWILADGHRRAVGLKYHRITGADVALADKAPYDRLAAMDAIEAHAEDFVSRCANDAARIRETMHHRVVLTAPFDAELFGHWWHEGPEFLNRMVRLVAESDELSLATPTDVMASNDRFQVAAPASSSWGDGGYAKTWLNDSNAWVWPRLHDAAERMTNLVRHRRGASGIVRRALAQAGRELLLASASDWPFAIAKQTMADYARQRIERHLDRFDALYTAVRSNAIDEPTVRAFEAEDNLFVELDPDDFADDSDASNDSFALSRGSSTRRSAGY